MIPTDTIDAKNPSIIDKAFEDIFELLVCCLDLDNGQLFTLYAPFNEI